MDTNNSAMNMSNNTVDMSNNSVRNNTVEVVNIMIKKISDANKLNTAATKARFMTKIHSLNGNYDVDARSLMGLFSLDLSREHELCMFSDNDEDIAEFKNSISDIIVG